MRIQERGRYRCAKERERGKIRKQRLMHLSTTNRKHTLVDDQSSADMPYSIQKVVGNRGNDNGGTYCMAASEYRSLRVESLLFGAGLGCFTGAQCTSPAVAVVRVARRDDGVHSRAVVVVLRHPTNSSPNTPVAVRAYVRALLKCRPCLRAPVIVLTV